MWKACLYYNAECKPRWIGKTRRDGREREGEGKRCAHLCSLLFLSGLFGILTHSSYRTDIYWELSLFNEKYICFSFNFKILNWYCPNWPHSGLQILFSEIIVLSLSLQDTPAKAKEQLVISGDKAAMPLGNCPIMKRLSKYNDRTTRIIHANSCVLQIGVEHFTTR